MHSHADRITAVYRLHVPPAQAAERAEALALEQSVELPNAAVHAQRIRDQVVARVVRVDAEEPGSGERAATSLATLALAAETVGEDAGQLLNMLMGNSSLLDDVLLVDVDLPPALAQRFGGPNGGIARLRELTGRKSGPLTCSALKPIGSTPGELAALCTAFAAAGIDVVKDDHGWAEQDVAPFEARVRACQPVLAASGSCYAPSLSGDFDRMRRQVDFARRHGVRAVLMAPMVAGVANFHALTRHAPDLLFIAHPALAGHGVFAPPVLLGTLFRLFGADATIFPNSGGRFSYSAQTCAGIATSARRPWHGLAPAMPVPAGGMTVERVPEIVRAFGADAMLLIGGSLLAAGERLRERCREFVDAVHAAPVHARVDDAATAGRAGAPQDALHAVPGVRP
jgi:ribulose-bisphosphate carboxylase large chain